MRTLGSCGSEWTHLINTARIYADPLTLGHYSIRNPTLHHASENLVSILINYSNTEIECVVARREVVLRSKRKVLLLFSPRQQQSAQLIIALYQGMKSSDEFTSPASFLKKQSHIITNNNPNPDFCPNTPTTRYLLEKEMHRSHFHSEANSNKYIQSPPYFDEPDSEIYSSEKEKGNDDGSLHNNSPHEVSQHPFDSFYQSEDVSSEQERSGTRSQKKLGFGSHNFKDHLIKKVNSNKGDGKFLFINSKKQKYNNNYLFQSNVETLKEEIKKYQVSIDKLKEENLKLRSQKIKLSSSNDSMHLIELRLELEALKKRIKQLETQKEMHLTIDSQKITLNLHNNDPSVSQIMDSKSVVTQLENPVLSAKKEPQKKETLTFRNNQGEEPSPSRQMNSPRGNRNESSNPQYQILQNMKSPYFLRKG